MNYANFWKRTAAYLVDGVICGIISYGACLILGIIVALVSGGANGQNSAAGIILIPLSMLLFAGIYIAYYVWPESSSWQATIGKKLFGLKVTDTNGQRISFWRSLGRNLGMIVSAVILYIGYLMCLWTEKKQCLHDQMANCLVVDETPNEKQGCVIAVFVCFFGLFLVVPLIVGILSAMAMPQYFRAVEKARATEAVTMLGSIAQAQQRHYLQKDRFASDFAQLDIDIPGATGNAYFTKGDPQTGADGDGFKVSLSSSVSLKSGRVTARRVKNGTDTDMNSYSLTRYYNSSYTSCIGHNENGATSCRDICGVNDLSSGQTCCTNGTVGSCPRD